MKCVLPRPRPQDKTDLVREESLVLYLFLNNEEIKAQDLIDELSISKATATRLLGKMVDDELIIRVGKGAATRYRKK